MPRLSFSPSYPLRLSPPRPFPARRHLPSRSVNSSSPLPFTPLEFCRQQLHFHPDPAQSYLLAANPHRVIVNCCRQWGKSTLTAAFALFRVLSQPHTLILVLSPSERQSAEFLLKTRYFAARLPLPLRSDGHNSVSLLFSNRSRIIGLPARDATIHGFSAVSLLIIDEASRVPDEIYQSVRPMLAVSQGDLWMLSTPYGKRGFFYETWAHAGPHWTRMQIPASQCPRIPAAYLEEERCALGDQLFQQEYCCQFVDPCDAVFSLDDFDCALSPSVSPLFPTPPPALYTPSP